MINVEAISSSHGRVVAVRDVSLHVDDGEIVCLLGANGAGKTTLLRTLSGLHVPDDGAIRFRGCHLGRLSAAKRVELGLVQVPEGRRIFGPLTVEENLQLGGMTASRTLRAKLMNDIFEAFPVLAERRNAQGGSLSGGEQQMLAIGRAMMSSPHLLLLDEPSLGLAPKMVARIFELIRSFNERGTSILIVEQNAMAALQISHRGYVMETGRIVREGQSKELAADDAVRAAYLGG